MNSVAPLLQVDGISKQFELFEKRSDLLIELITFGAIKRGRYKQVLRAISFKLEPGEAIRIVGRNGQGKSTLLKVVVGALTPDEGHCQVNGKLGVMLELGAGLETEITGLENAYIAYHKMNSNMQLQEYIEKVKDFSELGEYFDIQVKYYSDGMRSRLAFSMNMAIRPDIMIIDEVLSVGDKNFQKKCLQLVSSYLRQGSGLVFVSHMADGNRMFNKTYEIEEGELSLVSENKVSVG